MHSCYVDIPSHLFAIKVQSYVRQRWKSIQRLKKERTSKTLTITSFIQLENDAPLRSLTCSLHVLYGSDLSNADIHMVSASSLDVTLFCALRLSLIFKCISRFN